MFTGLIETTGRVTWVRRRGNGVVLRISASIADQLETGESISVNGACQTVVRSDGEGFEVDVVARTLSLTTLGALKPGNRVNLERALKVGDRMGGHVVTGHVDARGRVVRFTRGTGSTKLEVRLPPDLMRHVVARGSVAVDGISLTVAETSPFSFSVALIPETLRSTRATEYRVGSEVNIETDIMAKQQEKLMLGGAERSSRAGDGSGGVTIERLRKLGFLE